MKGKVFEREPENNYFKLEEILKRDDLDKIKFKRKDLDFWIVIAENKHFYSFERGTILLDKEYKFSSEDLLANDWEIAEREPISKPKVLIQKINSCEECVYFDKFYTMCKYLGKSVSYLRVSDNFIPEDCPLEDYDKWENEQEVIKTAKKVDLIFKQLK